MVKNYFENYEDIESKDLTQQQIVQEIAKYRLGNIDGLSNLLERIRSS